MFEKYIGQTIEIIYLDRNNKITQRKIEVFSITKNTIKAYCIEQRSFRIFRIENILAVMPFSKKRFG